MQFAHPAPARTLRAAPYAFQQIAPLQARRSAALLSLVILAAALIGVQWVKCSHADSRIATLNDELATLRQMAAQVPVLAAALQAQPGSLRQAVLASDCRQPCGPGAQLAWLDHSDPLQALRYERLAADFTDLRRALSTHEPAATPDTVDEIREHVVPRLQQTLVEAQVFAARRLMGTDDARRRDVLALQWLTGGTLAAAIAGLVWLARAGRQAIQAGLLAENMLRTLALVDPLTQLANRRALELHLPRMLNAAGRASRQVAVLAIELEGLERVAGRHGRAAGDELLQICAHRLYAHVRGADVVARLEGCRFAIVLDAPESPEAALAVGDRMLAALAEPVRLACSQRPGAPRVQIGAVFGMALFPSQECGAQQLLERAADALKAAQHEGWLSAVAARATA